MKIPGIQLCLSDLPSEIQVEPAKHHRVSSICLANIKVETSISRIRSRQFDNEVKSSSMEACHNLFERIARDLRAQGSTSNHGFSGSGGGKGNLWHSSKMDFQRPSSNEST